MAHDPTDLAGEEERGKEGAEAKRVRELQEAADLRWLMRQQPFRRFAWKLLSDCGVYRSSFSSEALVMALMEGRRDVGLALVAALNEHCPNDFDLMARERREKQEMKSNAR